MAMQRIAGFFIIAGFAFFVMGMFTAPANVYEGKDIDARLQIVANNQSRWILSKVFDGLALVVPAFGFLFLTVYLWGRQSTWPLAIGVAAFILVALLGAVYVYRLTVDPGTYWQSSSPSPLAVAAVLSLSLGILLFGIAFLQGTFPNWLGYLSVGASVLGIVGLVVFSSASPFYVTADLYIVILVQGIVVWRASS